MSAKAGDASSSPDWGVLSEELQAVLTNNGPLPYGALLTRYKAVHDRQLDFHGHRLRDSLANGNLKGLRFNTSNHTLELDIEPATAIPPDELLAQELRALVSSGRQLPVPAVANQYQAVYGKQMSLHGYSLTARLKDGNLPGLLHSEENGTMELTDALTPRAAASSSSGISQLADELRWLVIKKGPLLLCKVNPEYFSLYGKKCQKFGKGGFKASLLQGKLKGVRYDESSGKMELDDNLPSGAREPEAPQPAVHAEEPAGVADAVAPPAEITTADPVLPRAKERPAEKRASLQDAGMSPAASKTPPQVAFQQPISASKQPVLTSGRVSDVGGAFRPSPFTASSPSWSSSGTELPYHLIDSRATCKKALAAMSCIGDSLQHVCMGSMIVVQLNGRQLGSEAGFISLIKVCSRPAPQM